MATSNKRGYPPAYQAESPISDEAVEQALRFRLSDHELFLDRVHDKFGSNGGCVYEQRESIGKLYVELLRLLVVKAENPSKTLHPSDMLDIVWHEFLLWTKDYSDFCQLLGHFVHHRPMRKVIGTTEEAERLVNGRFKRVWGSPYLGQDTPLELWAWMSPLSREYDSKRRREASLCA